VKSETLGTRLGVLIVALVDLIAEIDGSSRDEVLEVLFTGWWESKIESG
jgi:hypothetical protein